MEKEMSLLSNLNEKIYKKKHLFIQMMILYLIHTLFTATTTTNTTPSAYIATTSLSTSSNLPRASKTVTYGTAKSTTNSLQDQNEFHELLIDFFNADVSPVINKAVNNVVTAVDKGMESLNSQIGELIKIMDKCMSSTDKKNASPKSAEGDNSQSAHPFPGTIDDYAVLIPIAMGTSRCGGCCTCRQNQMCLFNLYVQLQIITEKYSKWTPPNIFGATTFTSSLITQTPKNNSIMILEMLLSNLGKKKCGSCFLCKQINKNLKIAFMFNTDVLGTLFKGGETKNKEMMMAYLMNSQGIEQQMGMLPFLLKILSGDESGQSACPFSSQNSCNAQPGCPSNSRDGSCPSSNPLPPTCPDSCNQPNSNICPTTKPTGQPVYGIPQPPPVNPSTSSYGVPAPVPNPSSNSDKKPVYGISYGSYN